MALDDEIVSVLTPELTFQANAVNHVNEVLLEEVKELSNIQELALKEDICEEVAGLSHLDETANEVGNTPELALETNAVNHVNEVVIEEVKELSNIQELALKEDICEEVTGLSHLEETANEVGKMLSEDVKKDEILQELCTGEEQVRTIVPDEADQTECITQIKGIIPFEEDRVSHIVAHHLTLEDEIKSVITPELTLEGNAVNIVKEELVEERKELSDIRDLTFKENVCEEVADFANLEKSEDEEEEMLSEDVRVDKIFQELVIDREQVSKNIPDIADETESISQVKEMKVAGDRVFGITHENSLKEGIVRKCTSECASLETIKDVEEIPVEKSGQQFHLEKPTGNEQNPSTPDSIQEVKEDRFEDAIVERSSDESTEDKQDVRGCTREDASDTEAVTSVNGEIILLKEELHGNFDKASLQSAYESHNELEKYNAVKPKDVDCASSVCGCLLEEKNDLPDKNPQGVVVSGNTIEGERSTKHGYQIVNLSAQPSHNLEDSTSSSTKRSSLELNASAKEFVPRKVFTSESCFRREDSGPSSMKDSDLTGTDKHSKSEGRLNAEAKEFVPSTQARLCENRAACNSQS